MANLEGKMEEIMECQTKHLMMAIWNTNPEAMKIEQDPRMMQSMEEHQDVPSEDVVLRPVKGLKKRRRVWKLAAERRQKPKEGTRGYCR
jgi:hypothetical protein